MNIYSDLNPKDPKVSTLNKESKAIYYALDNLFRTRPGEVPFYPEFGIDIEDELFEMIDDITAEQILSLIFEAISKFEPRVKINFVETTLTPYEDDNAYELSLKYDLEGDEEDADESKYEFNVILGK